jgi:alpha-glucosidase
VGHLTTTARRVEREDAAMTAVGDDAAWWRSAVVYQIYPRSFADANGDGIGDLAGIISHVDHIERLGVDAVWLSPFYPSAMVDGGYDIDDHRDVDPRIGTLEQFDALVAALHARGIRVIVDIVPNHSSNHHPWFRAALAAPAGSPERDRYVFRDGTGPDRDEPPADWMSFFGGRAWTRVDDGQWYLHLFTPEQPDWNWNNRDVRDDFLETLRFWGDRGVDGFRVDVANLLAKDLPEPLPTWGELMAGLAPGDTTFPPGEHPIWDRDEVHDIYAEWRALFDTYSPPLAAVAEAWVAPERRVRYARATSLGQAFNFDLLQAEWDAAQFRSIVRENLVLAAESGASSTWVFSNHDVVRHASRFGLPAGTSATDWLLTGGDPALEDRALGLRRARAATLLALALPGSTYLYQGEELGLVEVSQLPPERKEDPSYLRDPQATAGRDGCRVPLPWTTTGESFGFGPGPGHLPQPPWFADYAVERQVADPDSTLSFYRRALALRRELVLDETFAWIDDDGPLVSFRRSDRWASFTNFGTDPVPLPAGELLLASEPLADPTVSVPGTTAWVRLAAA